jgi:hypothetical protein
MFTQSLEAFRSQNPLYLPPLPASPIPLLVHAVVELQPRDFLPVVVVAGFQTPPSLRSPAFPSPLATIPFKITSFAHPHHLTPIESHSCKKQGRGWGIPVRPTPFLFFPQRVNIQHTAPHATPLFSCVYFTVPVTHRVRGLIVNQTPVEGRLSRASIGSTGSLRYADHEPLFCPTFKALIPNISTPHFHYSLPTAPYPLPP